MESRRTPWHTASLQVHSCPEAEGATYIVGFENQDTTVPIKVCIQLMTLESWYLSLTLFSSNFTLNNSSPLQL